MEVPQNEWFIRENPNLKWMRTGGTPSLGNPQMGYRVSQVVRKWIMIGIWVWVKIRYPNNWMVNTKLD